MWVCAWHSGGEVGVGEGAWFRVWGPVALCAAGWAWCVCAPALGRLDLAWSVHALVALRVAE